MRFAVKEHTKRSLRGRYMIVDLEHPEHLPQAIMLDYETARYWQPRFEEGWRCLREEKEPRFVSPQEWEIITERWDRLCRVRERSAQFRDEWRRCHPHTPLKRRALQL